MNNNLKTLFTPFKICDVEIKNRIVMTSMGGTSLFGWMEVNHFDKEASKFILERAKNEVGLILPGIQPVYNPMLGQWLYKNKGMYKELKKFMKEVHATGAKLFIQLTAGFGRSFTIDHMMEGLYTNKVLRVLSKPIMNFDKICASSSESPNRWSDKVPSRAMTKKEIQKMIDAFAKCAKLCKEADVDGVEIHAVHEGYLLDQFTLKYINKRTDEYGGSFENRYRFPAEIVKAIKKSCGEDFPVSLRFSVESKTKGFRSGALPGEKYVEAGRDFDEAIKAANYLIECGYDMLNCDNGTYDAWYWAHPPIYMPENCNLKEVEELKKYVKVPVVCAGRMDPYLADKEIREGRLDAVGFARPFLADASYAKKLKEGLDKDIRPCICCHNGCFTMCNYKGVANDQPLSDALHMARCAVNAETMQTNKHFIKKAKKVKNIAIIGGGIGGMEAARVLTLRGHHVSIYEKTDHLGGVFCEASNASFKGKLRDLLKWYKKQMQDLNIDIHFNKEIKNIDEIKADAYIIATGSTPKKLPIKGYEKGIEACDYLKSKDPMKVLQDIFDNQNDASDENNIGNKIAVIGGGLTGCEIAYELYLDHKNPIIIEMQDDLIKQTGICMANSQYLRDYFALHNIPVYLETKLKEIQDDKIIVLDKENKEISIDVDNVILSAGYNPAPLTKGGKNVYLVGDCLKVGNLRSVIWRAYEVAMKI